MTCILCFFRVSFVFLLCFRGLANVGRSNPQIENFNNEKKKKKFLFFTNKQTNKQQYGN